ncbi:MAG: malonyl-CoA decarboxylase [Pseudomonadota bacterium]|nr:malonyl-CoA decarboxylase [Pseudomonadota bacterium]
MPTSNALGDILSTLLLRRPFQRRESNTDSISDLCLSLLSEVTEASGLQLSGIILDKYEKLDKEGRLEFFSFLNEDLDLNPELLKNLATKYQKTQSSEIFIKLSQASEPRRKELFRRLNHAPGATAELVKMRKHLLALLKENPSFARTDFDFIHLLRSWFNRGFLVLRQITWETPASILEKLVEYEAVHAIENLEDLRRRVLPKDRRCFAFFHPSMPDEPLIFVEVALTHGVANSIQDVLSETREEIDIQDADSAIFYSISNCQEGLLGISFGNSLIKQVVQDLSRELPNLKTFVTLSPIPGLSKWIEKNELQTISQDETKLKQLAANYLLEAKQSNGDPIDPVAKFHLGNGAVIHQINIDADLSAKGLFQSYGVMVNYLYDPLKISHNGELFSKEGQIAASSAVKSLSRQAERIILQAAEAKELAN